MMRIVVLLTLWLGWCGAAGAEPILLPADSAHKQALSGKVMLFDIRTPQEWQRTGIPEGAIALTMHTPKGASAFYENVLAAVGRDKSKPIAVICAAGNRSRWASTFLAAKGFTNVSDVAEGFFGNGTLPG